MKIRKLTTEERMNKNLAKYPCDYEFYDEDSQMIFVADDIQEYYSCNNCGFHYLDNETVQGACPNCKSDNTSFEELTIEEIYKINKIQDEL